MNNLREIAEVLKIPCNDNRDSPGSHDLGNCWRCRHNYETYQALLQVQKDTARECAEIAETMLMVASVDNREYPPNVPKAIKDRYLKNGV
jgi:hypothetical protein